MISPRMNAVESASLYLVRPSRRSQLVHPLPYRHVQWAISTFLDSAFQDSRNDLEAETSTCFLLTALAFTPTVATGTTVAYQKTPPQTKLQIPATVTTLFANIIMCMSVM